jgi:queuine tRNA-ribosyltransferase
MLEFRVVAESGGARAGEGRTERAPLHTPLFMPVGTHAAVNGLVPGVLEQQGAEILVCNAFRLAEKPGDSILRSQGGLHRFMGWPRLLLTDSGGFQVYRLEDRVVREEGVEFHTGRPDDEPLAARRSARADAKLRGRQGRPRPSPRPHAEPPARARAEPAKALWTPERAIEIQAILGSDFVMPLDVCVSLPTDHATAKDAMERTLRWAARCQTAGAERLAPGQTLFGIVQGATFPDLRRRCVDALESMGFSAYAIGGLNVGETPEAYRTTLGQVGPMLPHGKLRYLMGVGRPEAMLEAVAAGVDIMDSIVPTKYAREGTAFTRRGLVSLAKPKLAKDRLPIDPSCRCPTCSRVSRGYLHHLFHTTTTTAQVFVATHNVHFCLELMHLAREAVLESRFPEFHREFLVEYRRERS